MIHSLANSLIDFIVPMRRCVIAFSGGVDSAVIAMAAYKALHENSLAITAVSPSVARSEIENAKSVARQIGIRHQLIETDEMANPRYVVNDGSRCFHCKTELYSRIQAIGNLVESDTSILNGTNLDDLGDYRPGLKAAAEFEIISPFVDLEIDKSKVRQLARYWNMSVAEKPAAPCLASRIAYGQSVTPEKLLMIEQAEEFIRRSGFKELRVRYHENDHARIEVPIADLGRMLECETQESVRHKLREIGFKTVEVDRQGLRSGNLNEALPIFQEQEK